MISSMLEILLTIWIIAWNKRAYNTLFKPLHKNSLKLERV